MAKKVSVSTVTPPKIVRGKRGTQVPQETLDAFVEALGTVDENNAPSWATDSEPYETRAKANAQAMKIRKALLTTDGIDYSDPKQLQSRVWNAGGLTDDNKEEGPFYFALAERATE